ncbi:putative matrix metalloproteinase [Betaentomopoxvirus amoorei]|uniref:AMV070 n=1 Tax=Amsacta moorei entomopoxvirus TaxID=28321 RepID=Q9EMX9_AMEPV|nr:putative matrix metalloproteinase [Amsacta moorei entomopoxvirus]AAG02776.1 AMV070 [Amsacta moorei entomopoxvirus]
MIKNFILLFSIIIFSYNIMYNYENNNFIKKIIYIKDIIYFNKNINNMSDISEWYSIFKKLKINYENNNTLYDFINNIYNEKTVSLLDNIYKNIENFKYYYNYKKCKFTKNIYWNYINFNQINNTEFLEICNKSLESWIKHIDCKKFIFNNDSYYDLQISVINDMNVFDNNNNIIAYYYNKHIKINYNNIKKHINNKKFLTLMLIHEIGHFLGLTHINNSHSIMNPYLTNNIYFNYDIDDSYKILHYFDINRL